MDPYSEPYAEIGAPCKGLLSFTKVPLSEPRNKRAHATAHGEQAKHHVGVGVFVLPLQLSDNATPACRVCYEQSDQ